MSRAGNAGFPSPPGAKMISCAAMKRRKRPVPAAERARGIVTELQHLYPEAECALRHESPLQLLIATILSAQCTDARVNMVTPELFRRWKDAAAFARADLRQLESAIRSTGFFRMKARNIKACCQAILERHGGRVPNSLEELVKLPGVGRKTANVVLGNAFGIPGITVDTHVGRLSRRLELTRHEDPVKVEFDLMALLPQDRWSVASLQLILHGRKICHARAPRCEDCGLRRLCPYPERAFRPLPPKPESRRRSAGAI